MGWWMSYYLQRKCCALLRNSKSKIFNNITKMYDFDNKFCMLYKGNYNLLISTHTHTHTKLKMYR